MLKVKFSYLYPTAHVILLTKLYLVDVNCLKFLFTSSLLGEYKFWSSQVISYKHADRFSGKNNPFPLTLKRLPILRIQDLIYPMKPRTLNNCENFNIFEDWFMYILSLWVIV